MLTACLIIVNMYQAQIFLSWTMQEFNLHDNLIFIKHVMDICSVRSVGPNLWWFVRTARCWSCLSRTRIPSGRNRNVTTWIIHFSWQHETHSISNRWPTMSWKWELYPWVWIWRVGNPWLSAWGSKFLYALKNHFGLLSCHLVLWQGRGITLTEFYVPFHSPCWCWSWRQNMSPEHWFLIALWPCWSPKTIFFCIYLLWKPHTFFSPNLTECTYIGEAPFVWPSIH
jgi:hypothetical protein